MSETTTKTKTLSAEEFDRRFDEGEDISAYADWSKARRPGLELKRVNIDLPQHVICKLDRAAQSRGITRQALIKVLLYDAVEKEVLSRRDTPDALAKLQEAARALK